LRQQVRDDLGRRSMSDGERLGVLAGVLVLRPQGSKPSL
jgi:hypothetical protein